MFHRTQVTERRSSPRQTVAYRLDVVAADGAAGYLLDVSASGMRVRFKCGLDVSEEQGLRIEFPRWLELGAGLDLRGRFAWLRSSGEGATEAGYAFDGLSRKEQALLESLIQRLAAAVAEDTSAFAA